MSRSAPGRSAPIAAKLGLRNLARNRWRSGLTLGGVAVAVGLMVWTLAFYDGWLDAMIRGATAVETAQLQIQTAGYVDAPRVYESFQLAPVAEALDRLEGVVAYSPRVVAFGLVGNERRSVVGRILGVDPARETEATPVDDGIVSGRWLAQAASPDGAREVVLGEGVARQLEVGVGDELVVFLEAADGSLGNELLRVTGVVRTGNSQVDRTTAYMSLADAQFVAALEGEVNSVIVRTGDLRAAREAAANVARAVGGRLGAPDSMEGVPAASLVVRPWQDVLPAVDQMIVLFRRSYWIIYLFIYMVAAVGILNTQRMSALERKREFGVMLAIGMRPRRMFRTIQVETLVLAIAGSVLGALLGLGVSWYHATAGFDLSMLSDQTGFTYMGVAFGDRLYFGLSARNVVEPVLVMLAVALVSGLWPAAQAARIDPAPTIAGRT